MRELTSCLNVSEKKKKQKKTKKSKLDFSM